MEYGIDVAKWNGFIDWQKVKKSGKNFAIVKITNRNNKKEESFEGNLIGATLGGLEVGVYKYVYAKTIADATAEANAIVEALRPYKGKIPCGVWLDMEDISIKYIGKNLLTKIINTEAEIIRNAGFGVGIYCNLDWYKNVLDTKNLPYIFWIARYPSNDNGTVKNSLSPLANDKVVAWQYSSKGKVNGIKGNVDLDESPYKLSDCMKLFGGANIYI